MARVAAPFVASFVATVAIVAPAAWHAPDADITTSGRKVRPLQQSFTIDDAKVTIDVDRGAVSTGDSVKATLVAYSTLPKPVTVDLTVLQSHNYDGSRMESPAGTIDHERITLQAAPGGGKPVDTKLVLGSNPGIAAQVDDFTILVTAHGHKLDRDNDVAAGLAAAVGIVGWSGDNLEMSIRPQGPIVAGKPVTIAVRIANTSGNALHNAPNVWLATKTMLDGDNPEADAVEITSIDDPNEPTKLAVGAVMVKKFLVVPPDGAHKLTLVATASEADGMPGPILAGAMEVHSFAIADGTAPPEVAGK